MSSPALELTAHRNHLLHGHSPGPTPAKDGWMDGWMDEWMVVLVEADAHPDAALDSVAINDVHTVLVLV